MQILYPKSLENVTEKYLKIGHKVSQFQIRNFSISGSKRLAKLMHLMMMILCWRMREIATLFCILPLVTVSSKKDSSASSSQSNVTILKREGHPCYASLIQKSASVLLLIFLMEELCYFKK